MKRTYFQWVMLMGWYLLASAVWGQPANRTTIDEKVTALLSKMTLEEKRSEEHTSELQSH